MGVVGLGSVLVAAIGFSPLANASPQIMSPGSYVVSATAGARSSSVRVGAESGAIRPMLKPRDPSASFMCPASDDRAYSNMCAEMVIGIAPKLNCFFTDTVVPVASHDGNYYGIAGMQVVGWPYDNVPNAPVRLWYVYWLNIFNQPLTGYGPQQKLYAIITCV